MKRITIYTDGACKGNPGPGGWAALILWETDNIEELSGGSKDTTNNQMEMTGVIEAIKALGDIPYEIDLCSDSKYVIDALQKGWAKKWRYNNWIKWDGKKAKNSELWELMLNLLEPHIVHYHWIKGHAENKFNNRCDELAVAESLKAERS